MAHRRKSRSAQLSVDSLERRLLLAAALPDIALVSTGFPGDPGAEVGNGASARQSISADGRYVAFRSTASNLVPGDDNGFADVFVKDMETGHITLVSVSAKGEQGNGPAAPMAPSISADGRYVAFASRAGNLIHKDANGNVDDVFVKDLTTGKVTLVSQSATQQQSDWSAASPAISADGRYVAFVGGGYDGVSGYGFYRKDLRTNRLERVADGWSLEVSISGDGGMVVFSNGYIGDISARDMRTGVTTVVSAAADGTPANGGSFPGSLSADGRFVAFGSYATNLVADDGNGGLADIYVKDLATGDVRLVSHAPGGVPANDAAFTASLSADGRYVAFQSWASNLGADDTNGFGADAFVRDLLTDELVMLSNTTDPTLNSRSFQRPAISADGRFVAFDSSAPGHVTGDTNNAFDVFRANLSAVWTPGSALALSAGRPWQGLSGITDLRFLHPVDDGDAIDSLFSQRDW